MNWSKWIIHHGTLFGMEKTDVPMLTAWTDQFEKEGYTAEQMTAASNYLAIHDPPNFRNQHLPGLLASAKALSRLETAQRSPEPESSPWEARCRLCDGSGWAIVADPRKCQFRESRCVKYGTAVVFCRCPHGLHKRGNWNPEKARPQTYEEYAMENPEWQTWEPEFRELERSRRVAADTAHERDRLAGPLATIMERLAKGRHE